MGGKDDDRRTDLDKWLDSQRPRLPSHHDLLQDERDDIKNERRPWKDDTTSSSPKGGLERFKSFVDSSLGTFSESFKNFPSNISELKARMQQEREARRQEHLDIWRRWTGSEESPDHIRLEIERASGDERREVEDATYMLLRESYERNKHIPPQKILDLYRDNEWNFGALDQFATPMLSFGGACYYKPETIENLPSTARWGWPAPRAQWLSVDWFRRDPYSPIRLEALPDLSTSGSKWRAAFEDLLCAKLDKPMMSEEKVGQRMPYGRPQSTYRGPGLDWMLSLQCRGILPPQLPSLYKPVSLFDGFDEVKRPRTVQFMHDIDRITSNKSARMYSHVRSDLNALMDEVAIKSGPATEARPLRVQPVQTPWRVPETEQDLYDEMPPIVKADDCWLPSSSVSRNEDRKADDDAPFWKYLEDDDDWTEESEEELMAELDRHFVKDPARLRSADKLKGEPHRQVDTKEKLEHDGKVQAPVRPEVLSQLTTTQTTRLPDGTVTTKVVLKQRFADGREETHESVHQTYEPQPASPSKEKAAEDKPKGKGWFWN